MTLTRQNLLDLRDVSMGYADSSYADYAGAQSYDQGVQMLNAAWQKRKGGVYARWSAAGNTFAQQTSEQVTMSVYGMSAEAADAQADAQLVQMSYDLPVDDSSGDDYSE